ncbi:hypothetical protein JQ628_26610 [Bradyrhizobium lablabi]|uniref:hypothetical protein n=1 Tax=Bradyrhizobium lablabi TaxID=722472 RepID=UPI001BA5FB5D|nr:hypothetical protein [Bradyrhizobium lablabi]MBR1125120.1 hypothetical protein [Bradyrhizobium lablabi]
MSPDGHLAYRRKWSARCAVAALFLVATFHSSPAFDQHLAGDVFLTPRTCVDEERPVLLAQTSSNEETLLKYFLQEQPTILEGSTLTKAAQDIVVARVRILGSPIYLMGRSQRDPKPPKTAFSVRLRVNEVRQGEAELDATLRAYFGVIGPTSSPSHLPQTPGQLTRDYFVVMFTNEDGQHELAGFALTRQEYEAWSDEVERHRRAQRPGKTAR